MDKIVIEGGAKLEGDVVVSGAKNAALPLMTAAILGSEALVLDNVPKLQDVATLVRLLEHLGCDIQFGEQLTIRPPNGDELEAPYDLVRTMRASVLVLGPLLARFGQARVSMPGGCAIGARPIDQHLKGLKAMGAEINLAHGYVECKAKKLLGARIVLDVPTVTGVENLMMAATLARGESVIENAAREPEIVDLADALTAMGAKIEGAGTAIIRIQGVEELRGASHRIVADRIEAGTFMVAAALTAGRVMIKHARIDHLDAVTAKLREMGAVVEGSEEGISVQGQDELNPCRITTQPHPGFPTDMQAQFMAMSCLAKGQSTIKESIFENRFMHVPELVRMGANIRVDGRLASIKGVGALYGATVMATDLRASAGLILAGLVAQGTTTVRRVYHLDRGYEKIEKKLAALGANIRREKE